MTILQYLLKIALPIGIVIGGVELLLWARPRLHTASLPDYPACIEAGGRVLHTASARPVCVDADDRRIEHPGVRVCERRGLRADVIDRRTVACVDTTGRIDSVWDM